MRETNVLEVRGLRVGLKAGEPAELLQSVGLSLGRGRVLGIVGESGSGKSLTCSAILGLLDTRSMTVEGSIRLNGRELTDLPGRALRRIRGKEIGCIMQNPMNAFTPVYTVGSQFVETLRTHSRLSKAQAREQAVRSLESVNLPEPDKIMKRYPHQLSGGMLQRVMIAICLCLRPDLVIADEPTTALDAVNQLQVLRELERLKTECGTSVLLVSHDLGVIAQMADEVAVMRKGEIVEYAGVHELFDDPKHEYTRMLLQARPRIGKEA
ncbi:ABC transporter ATP-binding protein [Saccharibacillus alkalitolerans]|uniref:ABC transporter ATP-binding protein n=1 Tax=Saccharibacillus alkalitolerans TaxID=2705290 RepID=A0ABX0F3N0_9BACL|nr:ABC transporter ATP-binding protein [Saccharibacillus alkalitolerans]NGZ75040.1 ABC transporter ATP-binding protein [Saccharibacillus alkalitolerans]